MPPFVMTPTPLETLTKQFPEAPPAQLSGFLEIRRGDAAAAAAQFKSFLAWEKAFGKVTIADVAPFLMHGDDADGPDGCVVCLEDMAGGCARDKQGRPILLSVGMQHGSALEMQKQMVYAMERAKQYTRPGDEHVCTVVEVVPRRGARATFRFPDRLTRSVMDVQKQYYPGSACGSPVHFCGLPSFVVFSFKLCKPFMAKQTYENMLLKPSFKHLPEHMDKANMLKAWGMGGHIDFDFNAYVEWRAKEEGVKLAKAVRRFDANAQAAEAGAAAADPSSGLDPQFTGISALALRNLGDDVRKLGILEKQGSGVGLFATTKWKQKLVGLCGGCLLYFDSRAITETNVVARTCHLLGAYVEPVLNTAETTSPTNEGQGGIMGGIFARATTPANKRFVFDVVAPARSYRLACSSASERDAWIKAVKEEINAVAVAAQAKSS